MNHTLPSATLIAWSRNFSAADINTQITRLDAVQTNLAAIRFEERMELWCCREETKKEKKKSSLASYYKSYLACIRLSYIVPFFTSSREMCRAFTFSMKNACSLMCNESKLV